MKLNILHLNMFKGLKLKEIITYIKQHDFDIVNVQEITGGDLGVPQYVMGKAIHQRPELSPAEKQTYADLFEYIKRNLKYNGEITKSMNIKRGYFGNATFFKPEFKLVTSETVWMKRVRSDFDPKTYAVQDFPRSALIVELEQAGKRFSVINTHMAWGPTSEDRAYKIESANRLFNRVKKLTPPWILTGDFNVTPDTKIVTMFNSLGRNLSIEHNLTNTLNPRVHKARHLFPPGLVVDYIIVSPKVEVESFQLVEEDLSDHLGLRTVVTI